MWVILDFSGSPSNLLFGSYYKMRFLSVGNKIFKNMSYFVYNTNATANIMELRIFSKAGIT
jgi:hypothetical protein